MKLWRRAKQQDYAYDQTEALAGGLLMVEAANGRWVDVTVTFHIPGTSDDDILVSSRWTRLTDNRLCGGVV